MLLDVLANFVPIFVGHDDVADHNIGDIRIHHANRAGCIVASHDIDILSPEGDLNNFAHRRAVVDKSKPLA